MVASPEQFKSDQVTDLARVPRKLLRTQDLHGRERVAYFTFTVPETAHGGDGLMADDTVLLAQMPKGSRVLDFCIAYDVTLPIQ